MWREAWMRYLLMICSAEETHIGLDPEDHRALMERYAKLQERLTNAGARCVEFRLQSTERATTVRVRNGETLVTDGPFVETKDRIGGIFVVEAADLDEAIRWASEIPQAEVGCIEVRPVWEPEDYFS